MFVCLMCLFQRDLMLLVLSSTLLCSNTGLVYMARKVRSAGVIRLQPVPTWCFNKVQSDLNSTLLHLYTRVKHITSSLPLATLGICPRLSGGQLSSFLIKLPTLNWELFWLRPAAEPLNVALTTAHFHLHQPEQTRGSRTKHTAMLMENVLLSPESVSRGGWTTSPGRQVFLNRTQSGPSLRTRLSRRPQQGQTGPDNVAPRVTRARKPLHHDKVAVHGGEMRNNP